MALCTCKIAVYTVCKGPYEQCCNNNLEYNEQLLFESVKSLFLDLYYIIPFESLNHEDNVYPQNLLSDEANILKELAKTKRVESDKQAVIRCLVMHQHIEI